MNHAKKKQQGCEIFVADKMKYPQKVQSTETMTKTRFRCHAPFIPVFRLSLQILRNSVARNSISQWDIFIHNQNYQLSTINYQLSTINYIFSFFAKNRKNQRRQGKLKVRQY